MESKDLLNKVKDVLEKHSGMFPGFHAMLAARERLLSDLRETHCPEEREALIRQRMDDHVNGMCDLDYMLADLHRLREEIGTVLLNTTFQDEDSQFLRNVLELLTKCISSTQQYRDLLQSSFQSDIETIVSLRRQE